MAASIEARKEKEANMVPEALGALARDPQQVRLYTRNETVGMRETETHTETDRQTDREKERIHDKRERERCRQTERGTERDQKGDTERDKRGRSTGRQADRAGRQIGQAGKPTRQDKTRQIPA